MIRGIGGIKMQPEIYGCCCKGKDGLCNWGFVSEDEEFIATGQIVLPTCQETRKENSCPMR